ncbi:MAG: hypothetical protein ACC649_05555 [Myxococcota bacterium]
MVDRARVCCGGRCEVGEERKYAAGDLLMIPKGFTGIWHQSEDFRELAVIERKVYDASYLSE